MSTSDWNSNAINWLQPDSYNLSDEYLASLFPIFPDNYYFSPSVDLVSPIQYQEVNISSSTLESNVGLCHQTPRSTEAALDQQAINTTDSLPPATECGEYYVEGIAGRLPRSKRRKITSKPRTIGNSDESTFSLEYILPISTDTPPELCLSEEAYAHLSTLYQQVCLETTSFKKYMPYVFPSQGALEGLLCLYFDHFDRTMPFIHRATFDAKEEDCVLLLAMMAVSSCYTEPDDPEHFTLSMHEFVRRALVQIQEQQDWCPNNPVTLTRIQFLHAVGARYSVLESLRPSASLSLYQATQFCRMGWLTHKRESLSHLDIESTSSRWKRWIEREEAIRLGYCIWLLDCMWTFQFQQPPQLHLDDATQMQLPCAERLWVATHASEFEQLRTTSVADPPSMGEALQDLYIDKRLFPKLGEFSHILLIHGLFHRTWEVRTAVTQSLSRFEPSAQKQKSKQLTSEEPAWPPAVDLFARWRNSACDCLDILHWSANATIGAASGMEHPTVLHLHLARIVLLAPLNNIILFSHYLIRSSKESNRLFPPVSPAEAEEHRGLIQRWAVQDQYKARLAAIHAGVVFWHVRLYSIDAFYEPTAVALAALMFWALSLFAVKNSKPKTRSRTSGGSSLDSSPSPDVCDIILIDRPTDDELVQQFVRQGDTMCANITGVGDLFGPKGPRKVLAEGQKLLLGLGSWRGITNYWIKILNRLEKVTPMAGASTDAGETTTLAQ
ncbi:hypothetical protein LTR10_019087 [Elasticomyces elasticus]|uniref:Xylanolytic transcriptional activator regulatory domain-containing protein n=1 Tax=Exophiala sideris TaxID=1016849 RepID=A0ABR0IYQ5_9EURO|nr:hypothetical protein LTR10_019087 [Elasticomyces elasticus]KAK5022972.1 hypothetical protein LTS07_009700 [Exophiala sideris]KAK5026349.1 hypothetical protein LTR13_009963 [Exophiala sideris]KAK5052283.1 hypothetical protein LTR69_009819 [Exophiala sideris]KAK5177311.1 hypothetical protein LTR44_010106 [Eurotiomycetes sp. CCFEE 6388]